MFNHVPPSVLCYTQGERDGFPDNPLPLLVNEIHQELSAQGSKNKPPTHSR